MSEQIHNQESGKAMPRVFKIKYKAVLKKGCATGLERDLQSIPALAASLVNALLEPSKGFDSRVKGKPKAFHTPTDPLGPTPLTSGTSFHIILSPLTLIQPSLAHPRTHRYTPTSEHLCLLFLLT